MQMLVGPSVGPSSSAINGHNSVLFQARTSKFRMVVHIDPLQKLAKKFKRGVAPRGRGTCEYTLKWA